jgi:hypothetical protein
MITEISQIYSTLAHRLFIAATITPAAGVLYRFLCVQAARLTARDGVQAPSVQGVAILQRNLLTTFMSALKSTLKAQKVALRNAITSKLASIPSQTVEEQSIISQFLLSP